MNLTCVGNLFAPGKFNVAVIVHSGDSKYFIAIPKLVTFWKSFLVTLLFNSPINAGFLE